MSAYAHPPRDPNASSACGERREGGIADAESMMMDGIGILSWSNFVGVMFRTVSPVDTSTNPKVQHQGLFQIPMRRLRRRLDSVHTLR